jgi:hypothetical protein
MTAGSPLDAPPVSECERRSRFGSGTDPRSSMASDVPRYDCPSNELYGVTYRTATNGPPSVKAEGCSFPSDVKLSPYATGSVPSGNHGQAAATRRSAATGHNVSNPVGDATLVGKSTTPAINLSSAIAPLNA